MTQKVNFFLTTYTVSSDLTDLSSGVYLVRFSTNEEVITKKIVVIK